MAEDKILDEELVKLARGAYHAYGAVTDHKNYQGLPMPEWEQLTPKIQAAWCASCVYVTECIQMGVKEELNAILRRLTKIRSK